MSNILVTGGAGFIGSFIVDELINKGHKVRIFDNLEPRIHAGKIPSYLNRKAEFVNGDVRNYEDFYAALKGIDTVFHEASLVGIEPGIKEPKKFVDVNTGGTANLFDIIIQKKLNVRKVIFPSSVGVYGEGVSKCCQCGFTSSRARTLDELKKHEWDLKCPGCGKVVEHCDVSEEKSVSVANIYSMTKLDQEVISLSVGRAYKIPVVCLRYFNVYGPRQSIINPYSGVITRFIDNILNGKRIIAYEDGRQTRDFINVHDIVSANILAMENEKMDYGIFNVGSGKGMTIKEIAQVIIDLTGSDAELEISNNYREGDIRHCTANISKISRLGFKPRVDFREGLKEIIEWRNRG